MYDRDIQLLQFCAATLPPDEFLVHCLNKFGLTAWAEKVINSDPYSSAGILIQPKIRIRSVSGSVFSFPDILNTLVYCIC